MAQGDQRAADSASEQIGKKVHDWVADTIQVALCSDTFAASAAFTNFSQFTEVAGGVYTAQTPSKSFTRSGSKSTLQLGNLNWAQDPANPQDVRVAVAHNSTVAGNDDVVTVVDLTTDGSTPIDLQAVPLAINFASLPTLEVDR